jgi:hypothetical protein
MEAQKLTWVALGSNISSEIVCGSSFTLNGAFSFPFPLSLAFALTTPLKVVPPGMGSSEIVTKEFVRRGAGRASPCSIMESEVDGSGGDKSPCATLGFKPRAETRCARLLIALGQGFPIVSVSGERDIDVEKRRTQKM